MNQTTTVLADSADGAGNRRWTGVGGRRLLRSIGAKIFAIAAGLLALMIVITVGTAVTARYIGDELAVIERHYVGAYGALAASDIRSLQGALAVRRFVMHGDGGPTDTVAIGYRRDLTEAFEAMHRELDSARRHLQALTERESGFHDEVRITRLDTRLELFGDLATAYERRRPRA